MSVIKNKTLVSKEEVALMQLEDAIELFNSKRFHSAITLAGAAEEILKKLLQQHYSAQNILMASAEEIEADMFKMYKNILGIKNYHIHRNEIKNELKHHGRIYNKNNITADFKEICLIHLSGAIMNYQIVHNHVPRIKIIVEFCKEIGIS